MLMTVLGGCGVWPAAGQACSGFLIEHDGFRLVADLGYATLPRLLESSTADEIGAVVISHGHPDHCADLNPLLRARALRDDPPPPLPVYALPGALDAVLALDRPGMLDSALELHELTAGASLDIGPFHLVTGELSHWVPNLGLRLSGGGQTLTYISDSGPAPAAVDLASSADLLLAEATFVDDVPGDSRSGLSSARAAGQLAARSGAARLMLTHLRPGTGHSPARAAAAAAGYSGDISVAVSGGRADLR